MGQTWAARSIGRLYCRYCYANEVAFVLEIIGGARKSSDLLGSGRISSEVVEA